MIISYKYKFIFVHNPKAAGSSFTYAMRKCGLKDAVKSEAIGNFLNYWGTLGYYSNTLIRKFMPEKCFNYHNTALQIKNELSDNTWEEFFKFGFVRNPWDRQVSVYHFIKKRNKHPLYREVNACKNFTEYISSGLFKKELPQYMYFVNNKNEIIVNYIGKIEDMDNVIHTLSSQINCNFDMPHINKSQHNDYRHYYNENTKKKVEDYFLQDITMFGYDFDN